MPGHQAVIDQLAFDGHTTAAQAALELIAAEGSLNASRATALANDTPPPLPAAPSATAEGAADTAAPAAKTNPMDAAKALALQIGTKQAEARAAGRTLSAPEALALINKEQSNG